MRGSQMLWVGKKTYRNSVTEKWRNNPADAVRGPAGETAHPAVPLPGIGGNIIWDGILVRTSVDFGLQ